MHKLNGCLLRSFTTNGSLTAPAHLPGRGLINSDSYQPGSLKFKSRSDPYRPLRGSRRNSRAQSDIQRSKLQPRRQQLSIQHPQLLL